MWQDELKNSSYPPYPLGHDSLFVAYYASAELGCHLALGWPMPARVLDLFAEFRCLTSGLPTACGHDLLGALTHFGLPSIESAEKTSMRDLAIRGGPFTAQERAGLLDYCQTDVDALAKLLPEMLPSIDLPRALMRGRYMSAAAKMEWTGTPIDVSTWTSLQDNWESIQQQLITAVDSEYGVYEGRTFKQARFVDYLARHDMPWPYLPSGIPALDDKTFKRMAETYPRLRPLRQLRKTLGKLRLYELTVGQDGRNRCLLSPFRSKTGRNQPSNSKFIFGFPAWARSLIKPGAGRAVAYIDYEQQEFGIAAALSDDPAMKEAYQSGDPYLAFAIQAGAAPKGATKVSHRQIRDQFKVCALAVQYGMGAKALALSLKEPEARAKELLRLHRETYPKFWEWSQAAVDHAMLRGSLNTVFGWRVSVGTDPNPRSFGNFPMQANGAEILRLACCLTTERGIDVCAPIHDAILVEDSLDGIDAVVRDTQSVMREASEVVLSGFPLRTDVKIVRYPNRYIDEAGTEMWDIVTDILKETTWRPAGG